MNDQDDGWQPLRFAGRDAHDAASPGRRDFLKLMGASLALGGSAACSRPPGGTIVPYVTSPADAPPGMPQYYATATTLGGYAQGVLVRTDAGRPTKIEGNPLHPASLGGTDV